MKTYHGERSNEVCTVTVDGQPLRVRADLSGNASTAFDWGYIGGGQLSLALLSDFLGDDPKAKAVSEAFEAAVVAHLPHERWTLTGRDLESAVAPLAAAAALTQVADHQTVDASAGSARGGAGTAAFGDMPVTTPTV